MAFIRSLPFVKAPPVSTPDEDVPYMEGTTTLDDLAITDTGIKRIKRWSKNLGDNKHQRCHRCNLLG
ncbi:hypothetical protein E4U58_005889 [Claviceps cyperi]|nr:hypothetical protein E4U58_005889 [Claviceps cyperi]